MADGVVGGQGVTVGQALHGVAGVTLGQGGGTTLGQGKPVAFVFEELPVALKSVGYTGQFIRKIFSSDVWLK